MGYPETFEGFMIKDQSKWTDFEKKEVEIRALRISRQELLTPTTVQTEAVRRPRH